jgi:hypothetical protein
MRRIDQSAGYKDEDESDPKTSKWFCADGFDRFRSKKEVARKIEPPPRGYCMCFAVLLPASEHQGKSTKAEEGGGGGLGDATNLESCHCFVTGSFH